MSTPGARPQGACGS